jgi:hypothetical protein
MLQYNRDDNQREKGQGCMGDAVRSEISISEWCQELQQPCDDVRYHEGEERLYTKID